MSTPRTIATTILKTAALLAFTALTASAAVKPAILKPAQQFQQPSVILTGSWPAGIESADLNNDAHPDLIYTDYGATATASTTHILLNNGDGTFTPGQTIATAGSSIAVADFDRDGHPDLEWVWSIMGECRVYFAHGNGDGSFAPTVQLGTFAQIGTNLPALAYVTAAPMHDTGYLDLLVEDTANSSLFELTAGPSGTLIRLYGIHLPDGTGPMATADLNADGHTDLVIHTPSNNGVIDVFTGSVGGLLSGPATYCGPNGVRSFLLQDIDADAHPDFILEGANGTLDILHGFPDGTFSTTSSGGTNTLSPTTGAGGHLIALTANHLYTATPAGISLLQASNLKPHPEQHLQRRPHRLQLRSSRLQQRRHPRHRHRLPRRHSHPLRQPRRHPPDLALLQRQQTSPYRHPHRHRRPRHHLRHRSQTPPRPRRRHLRRTHDRRSTYLHRPAGLRPVAPQPPHPIQPHRHLHHHR